MKLFAHGSAINGQLNGALVAEQDPAGNVTVGLDPMKPVYPMHPAVAVGPEQLTPVFAPEPLSPDCGK